MKWLNAQNSDEHVLCDDAGRVTEYRVRCDPVTRVWRAYDGARKLHESLAIYPCQRACEQLYESERAHGNSIKQTSRKGRYSKGVRA